MSKRCGLGLLMVLLVAPSAASAADRPLLSLTPERVGSDRTAVVGSQWRVRVVLQPWVEGETATVRFFRHGAQLSEVPVSFTRSATGRSGIAVVPFSTTLPGRVEVRASHPATWRMQTLEAT